MGDVEKEFWKDLGLWLEENRKSLKLSRAALAEKVGVHRNQIYQWGTGRQRLTVWHYKLLKEFFRSANA